jgi:hypothetical protein
MRAPLLTLLVLVGCSSGHTSIDRLDCNSCHASDYDGTSDHAAKGYPRTCYHCHGLSDFKEAVAEHDAFAISRAPHAGWDCRDCHLATTDRKQISCTGCHWHDEARTRPYHLGVSGFEYAPASCLRCHGGDGRD